MLDEFELSCGTPSMKVVTAGLPGLEPMPRNLGLLSFLAVNSVKMTFGAKISRLAHDPDARSVDGVGRDRRDADRQFPRVLGLLLCGDGHRRQRHPHERIIRGLRWRRRLSGSGRSEQQKLARNTNTTVLFITLILGL